jgi:hypothetical protein
MLRFWHGAFKIKHSLFQKPKEKNYVVFLVK